MQAFEPKDLATLALGAALKAAAEYQVMSGGRTVHSHAIETYVSSKIAEAIFRATSEHGGNAALEVPIESVRSECGASRVGRIPAVLSSNYRFDAVCYREGSPFGLIEVKKNFTASVGTKDIIRLSHAVEKFGSKKEGTVKFGLWVALKRIADISPAVAEEKIEKFKRKFEFFPEPQFLHEELKNYPDRFKYSGKTVDRLWAFGVLFT
jgi:hypothetical protein